MKDLGSGKEFAIFQFYSKDKTEVKCSMISLIK